MLMSPTPTQSNAAPFFPLDQINTVAATPSEESFKYIQENLKGNYPRFNSLTEFKKLKDINPIVLVGGGPSLKKNVQELKNFRTIIACGSVHDFLLENNIVPTYTLVCDPDPITINYLKFKHPETKYLIASCCHPDIFRHLNGFQVILWHCHSPDNGPKIEEIEKEMGIDYEAVSGGCTVGLRAISVALMLGYSNIHFYGFDSCMAETDHHAYEYSDPTKEVDGEIYNIKIGMYGVQEPKVYRCQGYHMAQLQHFRQFYIEFGHLFIPTFHGEGMMPDYMRMLQREQQKMRDNGGALSGWVTVDEPKGTQYVGCL